MENCLEDTNHQSAHKKKYSLNSPMFSQEIERVVKYLPTKETPGLCGFIGKFIHLRKN